MDSLRAEVPKLKGKEKLTAMRNLFQMAVKQNNEELQYQFADELRAEAFKQKDDSIASFAWFSKIASLYNYGHRDHLVDSIDRYMDYAKSIERWDHFYYAWSIVCNIYFFKGQYFTSLREAEALHKDAQQRNSDIGLAWAYKQLGQTYLAIESHEQSAEYSEKAITLMKKEEKPEWSGISVVYNRYCNALRRSSINKRLLDAMEEWKEMLDTWEADLKKQGLATTAVQIHRMHWCKFKLSQLIDEKKFDEARDMLATADSLSKNLSPVTRAQYYYMLTDYYQKTNQPLKALETFKAREKMNAKLGHKQLPANELNNLANILMEAGMLEEAADIYATVLPRKDSVGNEAIVNQLNEMATLYEVDLKTAEARRQAQAQTEKNRILTAAAASIVSLLLLFHFLNRRKMVKQLRAKEEELSKANDQLRQASSRAVESARMKEAFVRHMGNEMKDPLNIISGIAQVISTPELNISDEERMGMLESIGEETDKITDTVNHLLELSNIESVSQFERPDTIGCQELCMKAIKETRMESNDSVAFKFKPLIDDKTTIKTNERHAVTMLCHLLDSARRHTKQGNITMSCYKSANGPWIEISVADSGNGLPEAMRDHIFDPSTMDASGRDVTHLNLCVCHSIGERLGGHVELEHTGTDGTSFVVKLPFNEKA